MITARLQRLKHQLGLGLPPSTGVREALQWFMLARLGFVYLILAAVVFQQIFQHDLAVVFSLPLAFGMMAAVFLFNLVGAATLEKLPASDWVSSIHIAFDVLVISCWIFWSGNRESLFALLYLIEILMASMIFLQKGAWVSSLLSCVGLGLVLSSSQATNPHWLMSWGILSTIFIVLGVVGGYLSEELQRTNQTLREKQRRFEAAMELQERIVSSMATGLLTVDEQMNVTFVNPAGEHILGRGHEDIIGKSLSAVESGLMPFFSQIQTEALPEDDESLSGESHVEALSATGTESRKSLFVRAKSDKGSARLQQSVELGSGRTHRILRGDVTELEKGATLGGFLGHENLSGRILLFQDVTKLLHLEEKLRQHEKLAAVGQLAAGIAHEIRNPLASMSASIEMLRDSLPVEHVQPENRKLMEIALREIDRLNRLISEFLDYVRPEKIKPEPVHLEALIGDLVLAARRTKEFSTVTELKEKFDPGVTALGSPAKLKQVVWNLIMNALQAMKKPGVLEVGAAESGTQVKFWVEDQGQGMTDEVLKHLYEPFFTTKEKGTGLGLATAYKIVEAHHGEIRVTSQVGKGTRFEVFLPKAS